MALYSQDAKFPKHLRHSRCMLGQTGFPLQRNSHAKGLLLVLIRSHIARVVAVRQHFHRVSADKKLRPGEST
jgi:hypothetical protein